MSFTWNSFDGAALAERRQYIGGSEVSNILAGGEDLFKLWLVKTGRRPEEDLSRNLGVQIGRATEELNIEWFQRETSLMVIYRGKEVQHPTYEFMRCHLDGYVQDRDAVFDAKHWGWEGSKLEAQVFVKYMPQLTFNALCVGATRGILSVFFGTTRWDYGEVEIDPFFGSEIEDRCQEFWSFVKEDREPPGRPAIEIPVPPTQWRDVDMTGNNAWADAAWIWYRNHDAHKLCETAAKTLKGLVQKDVGTARGHGVLIHRKKSGLFIEEDKSTLPLEKHNDAA